MAKPRGSDARLGLAEYLTGLRTELSKARAQSDQDDIKFSVDEVTLEVNISYTLTNSAESPTTVKPEFWVLGSAEQAAKDGAGASHQDMQRLIVRLSSTPETADVDEPGETAPTSLLPPSHSTNAE